MAIFKSCSDSLDMGRVCLVFMPVVTLQSFKMIGRLEVRLLGRDPRFGTSVRKLSRIGTRLSSCIFSSQTRLLMYQIDFTGQYLGLR